MSESTLVDTRPAAARAYHDRADELAAWAMHHLVNRTDRCGKHYRADDGSVRRCADPADPDDARDGLLDQQRLEQHFRARGPEDVIGGFSYGPDGRGRWTVIDIDLHGEGDPAANERYARHLFKLCDDLGIACLLADSDGKGGFHLWALFDRPVPAATLRAFGQWLVHDHAGHGLGKPPEVFPKNDGATAWGSWVRFPGRHHKRNAWSRVWTGAEWADGDTAVEHILSLGGSDPDLIPTLAAAHGHVVETGQAAAQGLAKERKSDAKKEGEWIGAWEDFNRQATLEDAENLLVKHGWQRGKTRRDGAVGFVRPGKAVRDGEGGNLLVRDGVPVFYCFTDGDPALAPNRGYAPAALYALLEHGGDFAAANRSLYEMGFGSRAAIGTVNGKCHALTGDAGRLPAEPAAPAAPEPEWPEPMAEEAFHGPAGELVRVIEPATEADPAGLLVQTLVAFGSLAGRNRYCVAEADRHYPNEFAVLVGRTARGRKGSSWGRVRAVLDEVDHAWADGRVLSGLSSGEGLIWAVRDPIVTREKIKERGQVTYQEVESDPGIADKRLLVLESEFANVLKQTERQGNTLSVVVRDAWDRGKLSTLTKNSPARATDAHISIVGHITDAEFRRYLTTTEAANGFANRFVVCCVRRSKTLPEGGRVDEAALASAAAKIKAAAAFARTEGAVGRDAAAREVWYAVYPELTADRPGMIGNLLARAESHVMRLSLIYALLDRSPVIRPEHLAAAVAVWEYADRSARYVFGESLGDPLADELLRLLRGSPDGLTRTDISNSLGRHQLAGRIGHALGLLLQHGLAHPRSIPSGGRPVERWFAGKG